MGVIQFVGALVVGAATSILTPAPSGDSATTTPTSLSLGTSTSARCGLDYGATMDFGFGSLRSAHLEITRNQLLITFNAGRHWQVGAVKGAGTLQWEFSEWFPHHRPIFNDNHGGTAFTPETRVLHGHTVSTSQVYFAADGRRIFGNYWYSPSKVVLSFPVDRLRELGVRTPFNWTASLEYERCAAVTER